MSELPLSGIRVCDLTWIIAGPTATRILADFGAEVIRVEHGQAADSIRFEGMQLRKDIGHRALKKG